MTTPSRSLPLVALCGWLCVACTNLTEAQGSFACPVLGRGAIRGGDACASQGGRFGSRRGAGRIHGALDINAPEGTPVLASAAGLVAVASTSWGEMGGTVILDHSDGWYSIYGHLASVSVTAGTAVDRGQSLGAVGYTGNAACLRGQTPPLSAHLHFALVRLESSGLAQSAAPLARMRSEGAVLDAMAGSSGGFGFQDPERELEEANCW